MLQSIEETVAGDLRETDGRSELHSARSKITTNWEEARREDQQTVVLMIFLKVNCSSYVVCASYFYHGNIMENGKYNEDPPEMRS